MPITFLSYMHFLITKLARLLTAVIHVRVIVTILYGRNQIRPNFEAFILKHFG